jgi:hypothetical protein
MNNAIPPVMSEIEYRDQMVAAIRRSFFGPESLETTVWPGNTKPATVVNQYFSPVEDRPIGPWITTDGHEILDQLPHRVYGIGVLYSSKVIASRDVPNAVMELEEDDDELTEIVDQDDPPDEADIEANQLEQRNQSIPRSLAFSVRIPEGVETVEIAVKFATYQEIKVSKQKDTWWSRTEHYKAATLSTLENRSEKYLDVESHIVKIGAHVRSPQNGSRILTIWLQNDTAHIATDNLSTTSLFQVRLGATFKTLLPYTDPEISDITSLDLLYRHQPCFAIGHGCDVQVSNIESGVRVETESLPVVNVPSLSPDVTDSSGKSYAVGMIDLAEFNDTAKESIERMIRDYELWINGENNKILDLEAVFQGVAVSHIGACREFLAEMKDGWQLVKDNLDIQLCLRHASEAMNNQRTAYASETREVEFDSVTKTVKIAGASPHQGLAPQARWRPFQIAFVLANIKRASQVGEIQDRAVDVIWMPTGGGKTEAYLGLSAFIILWERRLQLLGHRKSSAAGSTKVFMRYTYRLLTIQQLTRAASLICALEILREKNPDRYGIGEVRIGCWLGGQTTPNTRRQAITQYKAAKRLVNGKKANFVLSKCPWCGARMGQVFDGKPVGYRIVKAKNEDRVLIHCPDQSCHFRERTITNAAGKVLDRGIPLFDTDEDLYDFPPDFVVGTVDKVAMMSWRPRSGRIFGISDGVRKWSPPALLIQDELHLISGSLGSLDGNFETMIETLCAFDNGRTPLIIASTATTKNYADQISKLYSREARIIPPPGLDIRDSFFARQDDSAAGKVYVGIAPTGFVRAVQSQTAVLALMAHFGAIFERSGATIDPYWTNVAFFSSRRSLGMVMSSVEESFRKKIRFWRQVTGLSSGPLKDGKPTPTRNLRRVKQITATASEDVNDVLDQLGLKYPDKNSIDLCYATSMVEVGLDVGRLGLMTVMGQPKGSSQYIQVTGRVGRQKESPALIVVAFNTNNVRDRSHYESFRSSHERLYASVESASVTPYTTQTLNRCLRSTVTALLRILNPESTKPQACLTAWDQIETAYLDRAKYVSAEAAQNMQSVLSEMKSEILSQSVSGLDWEGGTEPFIYGYGDEVPIQRLKPHWRLMHSMRSVDADALGSIVANALQNDNSGAKTTKETPEEETDI